MQRFKRRIALAPLEMHGRRFEWGERTFVMGIINATPDSFSGDGVYHDIAAACARALAFADSGADIIDIGGESTRPGHQPVNEAEELQRVMPVVTAIRAAVDIPISIDTFKPAVAKAAFAAGADMVNCVWGAVPGIVSAAASAAAPLVIMHNRTTAEYPTDCVAEVIESLERSAQTAIDGGVAAERIIVDPGIGFGKAAEHNVEILHRLGELVDRLPYPLLVGTSRKSFIGKITGLGVDERMAPTAASVALAVAAGADIVRVHDVRDMVAAVRVAEAICSGRLETAPAAGRP